MVKSSPQIVAPVQARLTDGPWIETDARLMNWRSIVRDALRSEDDPTIARLLNLCDRCGLTLKQHDRLEGNKRDKPYPFHCKTRLCPSCANAKRIDVCDKHLKTLKAYDHRDVLLIVLKIPPVRPAVIPGRGGLWKAIPEIKEAFNKLRRRVFFNSKTGGAISGGFWCLHPHWDRRRHLWDVHLHLVVHETGIPDHDLLREAWADLTGRDDKHSFSIQTPKNDLVQYVDYMASGIPRVFLNEKDKLIAKHRRMSWTEFGWLLAVKPDNREALREYLDAMKGVREYGSFGIG